MNAGHSSGYFSAVPIDVRDDHPDALLNNTAARPTVPTTACDVVVAAGPGITLGVAPPPSTSKPTSASSFIARQT